MGRMSTPASPLPPDPSAEAERAAARARWGGTAAWILLAVGVVLSIGVAVAYWSSMRTDDRRAFEAAATETSSSMAAALQRNAAIARSLNATLATRPDMTNPQFAHWLSGAGAMEEGTGATGYAFIEHVTAAELPAFTRRLAADPTPGSRPAADLAVTPPGARDSYCLIRLAVAAAGSTIPVGLDICATSLPGLGGDAAMSLLTESADGGRTHALSLDAGGNVLAVVTPVFRDGVVPATVPERRAALLGWIGSTFDTPVLLDRAGGVPDGLRVEVAHRGPGGTWQTLVRTGEDRNGGFEHTRSLQPDGAWVVRVVGTVRPAGISPAAQAWIVLAVGLAFSGLVFALVRVLARGRLRALKMVAHQTAELRRLALHDPLTGLPNRTLILDRLDQALARAERSDGQIAVMLLDLDGFKSVNDTLGHPAGDQLLRAVTSRLTTLLRSSDSIGRLGGDEFVVLVEGERLQPGAEVVAERMRQVVAVPFTLEQEGRPVSVQVRASIGVALGGSAGSAEHLLRDADIALYEAKHRGRDRFVLFTPQMHIALERRVELENDMRMALELGEMYLDYQPIVNLRTGDIRGAEALLRWRHPTRGAVRPDEIIPVAEASGLIVPIGAWVLQEACRQAASWYRSGMPLGISVNVSGRQFENDDMVARVRRALELSDLPARMLTIEVTESVLLRDADGAERHLRALKGLGVRVAIDDFGTGYSSFSYLRQFPFDSLKIDRSFISSVAVDGEAAAVVHALLDLSRSLGIETLAEGIETTAQLDYLVRERCDSGQGFLFARPLTPQALEQLAADRRQRSAAAGRLTPPPANPVAGG